MHPSVRRVEVLRVDPIKLADVANVFYALTRRNMHYSLVDVLWRCFQSLWQNSGPAFGTSIARGIPFNEYLRIDRERMIRAFGESSVGIRVVWVSIGSLAFRDYIQHNLVIPDEFNGIPIPLFVRSGAPLSPYTQNATTVVQLAELLRVATLVTRRSASPGVKWSPAFLKLWDQIAPQHK